MSAERTEKATPKRREDARKKGQIARGSDMPAALSLLGALVALKFLAEDVFQRISLSIQNAALKVGHFRPLTDTDLHMMLVDAGTVLALVAMPVVMVGFAAVLAGNFAQGGFSFTGQALIPKAERFSPAKNIKKVISVDSVINLIKSILKLIFIAIIAYGVLTPAIENAPMLIRAPLPTVSIKLGETLFSLALRCGLVLVVLAVADYGYAFYKNERSMRMSKQEIHDEHKESEGDPMIKAQRRRVARTLAQKRSIADVPTASVIITNPTHFAVALRYDRDTDPAPVVVAKGADNMAAKIREIAQEHEIPLVENPPLARTLYRSVEPHQTIPVELFAAVAEILAYVFSQRGH